MITPPTSETQPSLPMLLGKTEAVLHGHFRLSSGLHSDTYIQCARLLSHPAYAQQMGHDIARKVQKSGVGPIDAVIGPALGGIIIAHEVARALSVCSLFAERQGSDLALRRGFSIKKGQRLLVVEDVITTGKSAKETASLVLALGGVVVGYACIVARGDSHALSPLHCLCQLRPQVFSETECVLCQEGVPLHKPGSRPEAV